MKDFKQPSTLVLQKGLEPRPALPCRAPSIPTGLTSLTIAAPSSCPSSFLFPHFPFNSPVWNCFKCIGSKSYVFMSNLLVISLLVASFLWTLKTTTQFKGPFPSQTRAHQLPFSLVGSCSCKSNSYLGIFYILNHKSPFPRVFSAFFSPCARI